MAAHKGNCYNPKGAPITLWDEEAINALADRLDEWRKRDDAIYFKQFFLEEDIHTQQFHRLLEKSERLRDAYEKVKDWQENKLCTGGLQGHFKEGMTKFTLWNVCKWTDPEKQAPKDTQSDTLQGLKDLAEALKK